MTTLSTHDTKRSEDVRARLAVLAELPSEWTRLVRWLLDRHPLADRPLAHLVWQNLRRRLAALAGAGARLRGEGRPRGGHVDDVDRPGRGVRGAAARAGRRRVTTTRRRTREIEEFVDRIAPFGWSNSLSQKLLQLTMPGVPDVYQGTELWDFSLVDPDNRRPVDYDLRRRSCSPRWTAARCRRRRDRGRQAAGRLAGRCGARRDHPDWFTGYEPVAVDRARPPTTWSPSTAAAR